MLYEKALAYLPRSVETRRLLLSTYVRLGNSERALHHAGELVRYSGKDDPLARETLRWIETLDQRRRGKSSPRPQEPAGP